MKSLDAFFNSPTHKPLISFLNDIMHYLPATWSIPEISPNLKVVYVCGEVHCLFRCGSPPSCPPLVRAPFAFFMCLVPYRSIIIPYGR